MEVNPAANAVLSQSQKSKVGLAENFETFLTLLTTQLQNQDPLDPLDSGEFTSQLVQFTSVEQAINTNDNLEALLILTQAASTGNAVTYIGKSVTFKGDAAMLSAGQAQWQYNLESQATETTIVVSDDSGKVVYSQSGQVAPGEHDFVWDGSDNAGNALPDGLYTVQVSATDASGGNILVDTFVTGAVTGVDIVGLEPFLKVGLASYRLSDILSIEQTPSL